MVLHSRARLAWIDPLMVAVTTSGTKGFVWVVFALLLWLPGDARTRTYAVLSVVTLVIAEGAINLVLKPSIHRERPYVRNRLSALLVKTPDRHSWPSGHAGSSMAAAIVLAVATWPWGIAFLLFAFVVGYSRVYVGVHYPTDVVSGYVVGALTAAAVLALTIWLPVHRL
jgi:undecaprenyl-diphosphatase